ncbi:MAG: hemin uptake protein HemP [Cellvibrionales bacterium]|nr:hemin uptake protein HemP [Cellvibrionales bacterium]
MPAEPSVERIATLRSQDIFLGAKAVNIQHDDQYYQLRITRGNKLILTK